MRVVPKRSLLAIALALGFAFPSGAAQQQCRTPKQMCDDGCTAVMELEAAFCSAQGFTAQAAVCHSVNMARYGGCLAQCHQEWGSGVNMDQIE